MEWYLEVSKVDSLHDGLATPELQEQQDSLKGRVDPGKATAVQVDRKKTSSKAKAELEVICQVGDGLYPAHNFVQASGFKSLPKELKESNNLKRFGKTIKAIHDAVEEVSLAGQNKKEDDTASPSADGLATLELQYESATATASQFPTVFLKNCGSKGEEVEYRPLFDLSADQRRAAQILTIVSNPAHMDTMPCEHMSLETLEEGIMFGLMLGHTYLSHEAATERRSRALNTSRTTGLYRDKVIYTHSYAQNHIKASEGYGKKVTEEKECCAQDQTAAMANHRDRRKYRRTAHKERVRTCSNQPGLLGPKALHVLRGLGHSRDESNRRRRHNENPAAGQGEEPGGPGGQVPA